MVFLQPGNGTARLAKGIAWCLTIGFTAFVAAATLADLTRMRFGDLLWPKLLGGLYRSKRFGHQLPARDQLGDRMKHVLPRLAVFCGVVAGCCIVIPLIGSIAA